MLRYAADSFAHELVAPVASEMNVRDGEQKWILKHALHPYVPERLVDRPKNGFGVPMAAWIRGPLRDWAQDLLSHESISRHGFLEPAPGTRLLADHLAGREEAPTAWWNALTFRARMPGQRAGPA